ncbi:MAG: hypothetical protein QXM34_01085 [Zestosphaera sp.]
MDESVLMHKLCGALEELSTSDELLKMVAYIVDDWLNNKEMSFQMLTARFLITFGEKGETFVFLLTKSLDKVIGLMDRCLEVSENEMGVYKVRMLVAKYHPLIYLEMKKRSLPHLCKELRAIPVNKEPPVIRVEAELFSGERVIFEIGADDVSEILDAIEEANREELKRLLTRFLSVSSNNEEECEEEDGENNITSKKVTTSRCRIITSM